MITAFGKFLRNLRMDRGEILKEMAEKLQVTSSFLSSVENGKKKIPANWVEKISLLYSLSNKDRMNLQRAYYETNQCIEIGLSEMNGLRKDVAFSFARKLNNFSNDELEKLKRILKEDDD